MSLVDHLQVTFLWEKSGKTPVNKSRWKGGSFNLLVFAGAVDSQTDVRLNRWKALGVAS